MHPDEQGHSASLPRGFRLRGLETPEPTGPEELRQPSPPRPRFKVRRRIASSFAAPTESFLASVAAADTPLPSIELTNAEQDHNMPDFKLPPLITSGFLGPFASKYPWRSPPRTPEPSSSKSLDEQTSHPDWYRDSTPDLHIRPVSRRSDVSDSDGESCFGSLASRPSDDGSCTSPDSDCADPFGPPSFSKATFQRVLPRSFDPHVAVEHCAEPDKTSSRPIWTKDMTSHLWSTYMTYLQDPRVTPFAIGASGIPPEGICRRVSREAKRSWKKSRPARTSSLDLPPHPTEPLEQSGSATPTTELPKVHVAWPHSGPATRAHLRELCRQRSTAIVQTHRHFQSRPTSPLTDDRPRMRRHHQKTPLANRLQTPEAQSQSFTKDMGLSLTASTAPSMQPDGPLAKLSAGYDIPSEPAEKESSPWTERSLRGFGYRVSGKTHMRQLSAPFMSHTYGPSSSIFPGSPSPFDPLELRKQPDTIAVSRPPRLGSPVRFEPRSRSNTQKRRAKYALEEELSPSGVNLRPSILDEQLFGPPLEPQSRRIRRTRGFTMGDEGFRSREREAARDFAAFASTPLNLFPGIEGVSERAPGLLPPRLGSPFVELGACNTFPRRIPQPDFAAAAERGAPFATMRPHKSAESLDSSRDAAALRSHLQTFEKKVPDMTGTPPSI